MKLVKCLTASIIFLSFILPSAYPVNAQEPPAFQVSSTADGAKLVLADLSNPIKLDDLNSIRKQTINESSKLSIGNRPTAQGTPEIPNEFKLVAYGIVLNDAGVPCQFTGLAGDAASKEIVYKKAQQWYETALATRNISKDFNARGANWVWDTGDTQVAYESPYGGVTSAWDLYWLAEDNTGTYDWWGIKHTMAMDPGYQAYSSTYVNSYALPKHDWGWGSLDYAIHDWYPFGTLSGTKSTDVSISGGAGGATATLGWTYSQPDVTTTDQTSNLYVYGQWYEEFTSNPAQLSTGGMKPGTVCQIYQPSSGTYDLLQLRAKGHFLSGGIFYHNIEPVENFTVTY